MKKRLYLSIILIIYNVTVSFNQCTIPYALTCDSAMVLDDLYELHNFECKLLDSMNPTALPPCLGAGHGVAHNTLWYKFRAAIERYTLKLNVFDCPLRQGVQWGIYEDCNAKIQVYCRQNCNDGEGVQTVELNLTKGKIYSLFVDGCNRDLCSYKFEIIPQNTIPLRVKKYFDKTPNCVFDSSEYFTDKFIVRDSFNGQNSYISWSNYYVPSYKYGIHYFTIDSLGPYFYNCAKTLAVNITDSTNKIDLDFGFRSLIDCPLMQVNITPLSIMRRCTNLKYKIEYNNKGTEVAKDAYIRIKLDSFMNFIGASLTPSIIQHPYIFFQLGNVNPLSAGEFYLDVEINCANTVTGMTHCVEAHIYPDSSCAINSLWNNASIELRSKCTDSKAIFEIWNIGRGDMTDSSHYVLIANDNVPTAGKGFILKSNEHLTIERLAIGNTYRLLANQVKYHPGYSSPSIAIEACGKNLQGDFLRGYITNFKEDDSDFFIDKDCQQSIGSFDPNDKSAVPKGLGLNGIIPLNEAIEYTIRFQNIGTDTAFRVVVRDEINFQADLSSFELISISHPNYNLRLEGYVIEFTFDNILLPHKAIDEPNSNGYIKFKILPTGRIGSIIRNKANIYFDYNSPITTNSVQHQLGQKTITVSTKTITKEKQLYIIPNPNNGNFEIDFNQNYINGYLTIYNFLGKEVFSQKIINTDRQNLYFDNLHSGIYFCKLTQFGSPSIIQKFVVR